MISKVGSSYPFALPKLRRQKGKVSAWANAVSVGGGGEGARARAVNVDSPLVDKDGQGWVARLDDGGLRELRVD